MQTQSDRAVVQSVSEPQGKCSLSNWAWGWKSWYLHHKTRFLSSVSFGSSTTGVIISLWMPGLLLPRDTYLFPHKSKTLFWISLSTFKYCRLEMYNSFDFLNTKCLLSLSLLTKVSKRDVVLEKETILWICILGTNTSLKV
jgi:hypothetical protein